MTLNSIFQFLVPKDKTFYPLFEQAANKIKLLSETLNDAVKLPANDRDKLLKEVEVLKSEIEAIVQTTRLELERNFITPFDREDINMLASGLDDIADYIYASAKYIFLYKTPEIKEFSEISLLIHKSCIEIKSAMLNLNGFKDGAAVKESCIKINSFENIADDVLSQALVKLFENGDPITIIKAKDVLEYLEVVTDKAEDVANTIENILIKYA